MFNLQLSQYQWLQDNKQRARFLCVIGKIRARMRKPHEHNRVTEAFLNQVLLVTYQNWRIESASL